MSFSEYIGSRWEHILELTLQHLEIVAPATAVASVLAVATGAFVYPRDQIVNLDEGLIYPETKKAEKCKLGEVETTDARIKSNGLVVLGDPNRFFPYYNPAITLHEELAAKHPELTDVFRTMYSKIDTETMIRLNGEVQLEGREPADVAKDWLEQSGLV